MLTFCSEQCIYALFMDPQISFFINFFIKNESHGTIYTFKNYFATVISAINFQFQQNKSYPNRPLQDIKTKTRRRTTTSNKSTWRIIMWIFFIDYSHFLFLFLFYFSFCQEIERCSVKPSTEKELGLRILKRQDHFATYQTKDMC